LVGRDDTTKPPPPLISNAAIVDGAEYPEGTLLKMIGCVVVASAAPEPPDASVQSAGNGLAIEVSCRNKGRSKSSREAGVERQHFHPIVPAGAAKLKAPLIGFPAPAKRKLPLVASITTADAPAIAFVSTLRSRFLLDPQAVPGIDGQVAVNEVPSLVLSSSTVWNNSLNGKIVPMTSGGHKYATAKFVVPLGTERLSTLERVSGPRRLRSQSSRNRRRRSALERDSDNGGTATTSARPSCLHCWNHHTRQQHNHRGKRRKSQEC